MGAMELKELLKKNRSYRRYDGHYALDRATLVSLVGLTRLCPSASNRQPLKYFLSWEKATNDIIFSCVRWAGALKNWGGPSESERATGYIVILGDTRIAKNFFCDHGIAAQSILLGAAERGLGGCMLASFNKDKLKPALRIPDHFDVLLAIAIGKPQETVVLDFDKNPDEIPYWRDEQGAHHVPKRALEQLIVEF